MIIGIDLDNTLVFCNAIEYVSKKLGYNFTDRKKRDWYFTGWPEDFRTEVFKTFRNPVFMGNLKPIPGAVKKLEEWRNSGHSIVILTSRSSSSQMMNVTMDLVEKCFSYNALTAVGTKSKKEDMKHYKLNVWIDDSPHGVEESLELGIKTYLISNYRTPYNWEAAKNKSLTVVKSVKDVKL